MFCLPTASVLWLAYNKSIKKGKLVLAMELNTCNCNAMLCMYLILMQKTCNVTMKDVSLSFKNVSFVFVELFVLFENCDRLKVGLKDMEHLIVKMGSRNRYFL